MLCGTQLRSGKLFGEFMWIALNTARVFAKVTQPQPAWIKAQIATYSSSLRVTATLSPAVKRAPQWFTILIRNAAEKLVISSLTSPLMNLWFRWGDPKPSQLEQVPGCVRLCAVPHFECQFVLLFVRFAASFLSREFAGWLARVNYEYFPSILLLNWRISIVCPQIYSCLSVFTWPSAALKPP